MIDCGPDFRQQMLRSDVRHLDAILLTHEHNDHVIGLDDVRPFNFRSQQDMPIYTTKSVMAEVQQRFAYAFSENPYPGAPSFRFFEIDPLQSLEVAGIPVQPITILHGKLPILGFRIGGFTYLTDIKSIDPAELEKIRGTQVLALGVLHHTPHHSHLSVEEALELVARIRPQQTYFIHVSHHMGRYEDVLSQLPPNVALAYDGLKVTVAAP